ncbi:uncharacterized protein LOC143222212 isoform X2 [Tachypleus tridentatus]|uniref:uncharacterized protein LOC143222212 isoform X2 n=1 Tax=Tachypleus tridentatus TaxID=6853 RepID=UPI003FD5CE93
MSKFMEFLPVLLLCFMLCRPGLGNQQWEGKIENMLLSLQVNVRSLEGRMSQLNVMEYAFKINNIDSRLEAILQKVEENDNKLLALQSEVERLSQQLSSRSRDKSTPDRSDESEQNQPLVLEKVEGYSQKILRAHQTLLDILKVTNEKVTNGLNKMFEKFNSFVQLKSLENSFQRVAQNVEIVHGKINSITTTNAVTSTVVENLQGATL